MGAAIQTRGFVGCSKQFQLIVEEFLVEQAILDETCRIESLDDLQQNVDVFSPLYKLPLDEINDLKSVELLNMRPRVIPPDMSRSNRKYNMTRRSIPGGMLTIFACS